MNPPLVSAATSGVNLPIYKTLMFGVSAAFGGLAGTMLMMNRPFASDVQFGLNADKVGDDIHEITLKVEVAAKSDNGTHFIGYGSRRGIGCRGRACEGDKASAVA